MFGDLMGGMQEKQDAMREKLDSITIDSEAGNGAVKITVTASRRLVNISIDKSIVDPEDTEQMEDLILVAVNEAMDLAAKKEADMAQEILRDMMPPGMGNLGNLF